MKPQDYPMGPVTFKHDATLTSLAWIIETTDIGMGIVLVLPGGVLHGTLIKKATWYKEWFEILKKGAKGEGDADFAIALDAIYTASGRMDADKDVVDHVGLYLHIKEGVLRTPGGHLNAMPWRVRLDTVSAWSLGSAPSDTQE